MTGPVGSRRIVQLDLAATGAFVGVGAASLASDDVAKNVLAPFAFVYAGIGVVLFLWSYFAAIGRSRESEIAVSQLYVVSGDVAPPPVKRALRWSLWVQIAVALVVMVAGFSRTDPEHFNWAATAIIVPLLGFALNGVWVARYGTFAPRILTPRPARRSRRPAPEDTAEPDEKPGSGDEMEQNSRHG